MRQGNRHAIITCARHELVRLADAEGDVGRLVRVGAHRARHARAAKRGKQLERRVHLGAAFHGACRVHLHHAPARARRLDHARIQGLQGVGWEVPELFRQVRMRKNIETVGRGGHCAPFVHVLAPDAVGRARFKPGALDVLVVDAPGAEEVHRPQHHVEVRGVALVRRTVLRRAEPIHLASREDGHVRMLCAGAVDVGEIARDGLTGHGLVPARVERARKREVLRYSEHLDPRRVSCGDKLGHRTLAVAAERRVGVRVHKRHRRHASLDSS